jgi:uncharacterized membrane protein YoaT (DUF817 family)
MKKGFSQSFGLNWFSLVLLIGFALVLMAIHGVFGPLAKIEFVPIDWSRPLSQQVDWLLIFDFAVMMTLLIFGAELEKDLLIIIVGFFGGLYIEAWGTQTEIWRYYTDERPPWWIIPAWSMASLAIDRLVRILNRFGKSFQSNHKIFVLSYWLLLIPFFCLMIAFVYPTINKSLTIVSLILSALVILTPTDYRMDVLNFIAGASLGYFLELWGTTRECWIYYTNEQPPLFAVLAHGMAAVAFWRGGLLVKQAWIFFQLPRFNRNRDPLSDA